MDLVKCDDDVGESFPNRNDLGSGFVVRLLLMLAVLMPLVWVAVLLAMAEDPLTSPDTSAFHASTP